MCRMIHGPRHLTAPFVRVFVARFARFFAVRVRRSLLCLAVRVCRFLLLPCACVALFFFLFVVRVCRSLLCRASLSSLRVCRSLLCQSACVALSSLSCGLSDALQAVNTGSTGSDSNRMRDFDRKTALLFIWTWGLDMRISGLHQTHRLCTANVKCVALYGKCNCQLSGRRSKLSIVRETV